ncbi:hypothetical protein NL676_008242 [Syzygium grande]|nr:hypothetical protein NL676_008242 [Syzygium grande]
MAEAIIWRISDLLDDLPKDRKSWAVGGELHRLKKTVSAVRSVVRDAEKRLLDDFMDQQFMVDQTLGGIREWFDDLKAAFYDAEDLLEEWSIEVTRRELPGKDEKLEQCFVFCSLFPEDSVIDKLMLTSLWMAEGFIRPIDNVDWDMEDIAHDCFMDLLRRNFFRDCIEDEFGNVTSYFLLPGDDSRPKNCGGLGELNRLSKLRGSLRIEVKGKIEDGVAESNAANLKEKDSLVSPEKKVMKFYSKSCSQA